MRRLAVARARAARAGVAGVAAGRRLGGPGARPPVRARAARNRRTSSSSSSARRARRRGLSSPRRPAGSGRARTCGRAPSARKPLTTEGAIALSRVRAGCAILDDLPANGDLTSLGGRARWRAGTRAARSSTW